MAKPLSKKPVIAKEIRKETVEEKLDRVLALLECDEDPAPPLDPPITIPAGTQVGDMPVWSGTAWVLFHPPETPTGQPHCYGDSGHFWQNE